VTLPTGNVTFLVTDIEGSTRLWEVGRAAIARVVARHDPLLRTTIERQIQRFVRYRTERSSLGVRNSIGCLRGRGFTGKHKHPEILLQTKTGT
jgi:class 3 adenylate cyclase